MARTVMMSVLLLAFCPAALEAGYLRQAATPAGASKESSSDATAAAEQALAAVAAAEAARKPSPPATPAAGQQATRARLDVGFGDFEKNLTAEVSTALLKTASGTAWSKDMRAELEKNITESLKTSLKDVLKPVKQSIGKTWMALPQDEQKNEYVSQLKNSFMSVFDSSMKTVESHLRLSLKRVETLSSSATKKMDEKQLLEKSEYTLLDSLVLEHCYERDAKKSLKSVQKPQAGNTSKAAVSAPAEKTQFCIQSVLGGLVKRLNDTQSLISMSMRFESGAMSLAQKKQKSH